MTRQEKAIQRYIAERFFYEDVDEFKLAQIQPPFEFGEDARYAYDAAYEEAVILFGYHNKYSGKLEQRSSLPISAYNVTEFINEVCTLMEGEVDD